MGNSPLSCQPCFQFLDQHFGSIQVWQGSQYPFPYYMAYSQIYPSISLQTVTHYLKVLHHNPHKLFAKLYQYNVQEGKKEGKITLVQDYYKMNIAKLNYQMTSSNKLYTQAEINLVLRSFLQYYFQLKRLALPFNPIDASQVFISREYEPKFYPTLPLHSNSTTFNNPNNTPIQTSLQTSLTQILTRMILPHILPTIIPTQRLKMASTTIYHNLYIWLERLQSDQCDEQQLLEDSRKLDCADEITSAIGNL